MNPSTAAPPPAPLGLFPGRWAPRLYDRVVEVLRTRHYSRRTEDACVGWIRRPGRKLMRPAKEMRSVLSSFSRPKETKGS